MSQDYEAIRQTPTQEELAIEVESLQSFAAFDAWMDEQLALLISTWAHAAAPSAHRAERLWRRFGR